MAVNQDAGDDDNHWHTSTQVTLGGGGGRGKYVSCDGDVPVAKVCGRTDSEQRVGYDAASLQQHGRERR